MILSHLQKWNNSYQFQPKSHVSVILQIAGASLFRTPKAVVATALHSEANVLEKIAKSISTNLLALQLANKEFCIPGKNASLGVFQTGDLVP